MIVRKASTTLTLAPAVAPPPERAFEPLDWQGSVRLDAAHAAGISAPRWQQHVRTGLLERALSLGADLREGPHADRPEVARRLLAHVDALAEAGLSFEGLQAFSDEAELDNPRRAVGADVALPLPGSGGRRRGLHELPIPRPWGSPSRSTRRSSRRGSRAAARLPPSSRGSASTPSATPRSTPTGTGASPGMACSRSTSAASSLPP